MTSPTGSKLQGRDSIQVDAPSDLLWRLIADSNELPSWGPPVKGVEVMVEQDQVERTGTPRKVYAAFGRKSGYFVEHRVEHVPSRKIAYLIDKETFGLARVMSRPGFSLELEPLGTAATRVVFSFFHDPRGVGRLLNPLIKLQQRRNRLAALASLKRRAEELHSVA
jgi:hypothetical protein